jgi:predicted regulator of Ras-like GTPase activity (Roadblock/LC7/MglB family)
VIELGAVAIQLKRVVEGLGSGDVQEFTVHTGGLTTVLRPLTPEYFLALAMEPTGLLGKGRYLMRIVAPALLTALA